MRQQRDRSDSSEGPLLMARGVKGRTALLHDDTADSTDRRRAGTPPYTANDDDDDNDGHIVSTNYIERLPAEAPATIQGPAAEPATSLPVLVSHVPLGNVSPVHLRSAPAQNGVDTVVTYAIQGKAHQQQGQQRAPRNAGPIEDRVIHIKSKGRERLAAGTRQSRPPHDTRIGGKPDVEPTQGKDGRQGRRDQEVEARRRGRGARDHGRVGRETMARETRGQRDRDDDHRDRRHSRRQDSRQRLPHDVRGSDRRAHRYGHRDDRRNNDSGDSDSDNDDDDDDENALASAAHDSVLRATNQTKSSRPRHTAAPARGASHRETHRDDVDMRKDGAPPQDHGDNRGMHVPSSVPSVPQSRHGVDEKRVEGDVMVDGAHGQPHFRGAPLVSAPTTGVTVGVERNRGDHAEAQGDVEGPHIMVGPQPLDSAATHARRHADQKKAATTVVETMSKKDVGDRVDEGRRGRSRGRRSPRRAESTASSDDSDRRPDRVSQRGHRRARTRSPRPRRRDSSPVEHRRHDRSDKEQEGEHQRRRAHRHRSRRPRSRDYANGDEDGAGTSDDDNDDDDDDHHYPLPPAGPGLTGADARYVQEPDWGTAQASALAYAHSRVTSEHRRNAHALAAALSVLRDDMHRAWMDGASVPPAAVAEVEARARAFVRASCCCGWEPAVAPLSASMNALVNQLGTERPQEPTACFVALLDALVACVRTVLASDPAWVVVAVREPPPATPLPDPTMHIERMPTKHDAPQLRARPDERVSGAPTRSPGETPLVQNPDRVPVGPVGPASGPMSVSRVDADVKTASAVRVSPPTATPKSAHFRPLVLQPQGLSSPNAQRANAQAGVQHQARGGSTQTESGGNAHATKHRAPGNRDSLRSDSGSSTQSASEGKTPSDPLAVDHRDKGPRQKEKENDGTTLAIPVDGDIDDTRDGDPNDNNNNNNGVGNDVHCSDNGTVNRDSASIPFNAKKSSSAECALPDSGGVKTTETDRPADDAMVTKGADKRQADATAAAQDGPDGDSDGIVVIRRAVSSTATLASVGKGPSAVAAKGPYYPTPFIQSALRASTSAAAFANGHGNSIDNKSATRAPVAPSHRPRPNLFVPVTASVFATRDAIATKVADEVDEVASQDAQVQVHHEDAGGRPKETPRENGDAIETIDNFVTAKEVDDAGDDRQGEPAPTTIHKRLPPLPSPNRPKP